jgi:predicted nucleic acid-binding protein
VIVVDSSVWIDLFNGRRSPHTEALDRLLADPEMPVLVGDIVMYEVLAGFRTRGEVERNRLLLETLILVSMVDFDLVPRAIANYQALRQRGITPSTVDMIIGTYCIEIGAELLTTDRDFVSMRDHLGLRLAVDGPA